MRHFRWKRQYEYTPLMATRVSPLLCTVDNTTQCSFLIESPVSSCPVRTRTLDYSEGLSSPFVNSVIQSDNVRKAPGQ